LGAYNCYFKCLMFIKDPRAIFSFHLNYFKLVHVPSSRTLDAKPCAVVVAACAIFELLFSSTSPFSIICMLVVQTFDAKLTSSSRGAYLSVQIHGTVSVLYQDYCL